MNITTLSRRQALLGAAGLLAASSRAHLQTAASFARTWETDFGPLRLVQNGARVTGEYASGGPSTLLGTVEGRTLTFTWSEQSGAAGEGTFTLSPDGARADAATGKKYLVVLESHWEKSLGEPEYSFGQMLKSFFSRVPSVEVRQRFVHDEADLRRFCTEAAYLSAPSVLYLSSHGNPNGLSIGGKTVPPAVIGESLKAARSLRLLHLGSCQLMAGSGPATIRRAAGLSFPISGYVNTADWAGSAAIDFLYLDLVLSRNIAPTKAVAQTRQMLSIATERTAAGMPVAACDLKIF